MNWPDTQLRANEGRNKNTLLPVLNSLLLKVSLKEFFAESLFEMESLFRK